MKYLMMTCALALSTPALAQQGAPPSAPPQSAEQEVEPVSDSELQDFAKAMDKVETLRASAEAELRETEDRSQAQEIQTEARTKMVKAIEKTGLEIERYNEIANAIATDQELYQRLQDVTGEDEDS